MQCIKRLPRSRIKRMRAFAKCLASQTSPVPNRRPRFSSIGLHCRKSSEASPRGPAPDIPKALSSKIRQSAPAGRLSALRNPFRLGLPDVQIQSMLPPYWTPRVASTPGQLELARPLAVSEHSRPGRTKRFPSAPVPAHVCILFANSIQQRSFPLLPAPAPSNNGKGLAGAIGRKRCKRYAAEFKPRPQPAF